MQSRLADLVRNQYVFFLERLHFVWFSNPIFLAKFGIEDGLLFFDLRSCSIDLSVLAILLSQLHVLHCKSLLFSLQRRVIRTVLLLECGATNRLGKLGFGFRHF